MTKYLSPRVLDLGLTVLDTEANALHICDGYPASYAGIVSLGVKTGLSIGSPADATPSGRKVTIPAQTDDSVVASASGDAGHYAVVDTVNSRILAVGELSAPQTVTSGNPLRWAAIDITLPGPA